MAELKTYQAALSIAGRVTVQAENEEEAELLAEDNFGNMHFDEFEVLWTEIKETQPTNLDDRSI
jgi:hypothetical protein